AARSASPAVAAAAGRTPRSCRCRSGPRRGHRGRTGPAGSPGPGWGWGWRSRFRRARATARATARANRTSWELRSVVTARELPGRACATRGRCGVSGWISRAQNGANDTRSRLNARMASGEQADELLVAHRVPDPVALGEVAAALAQDRVLAFLLHALGDHGDAQRMGHRDDRGGQGQVVGVAQHVGNEAAVDLDPVRRHPAQVAEPGETGAEV